ncbi:hypothetical protein D3874_14860 [Oleomonas cavernae]|uniref:Uncharacterized protein n=1 Tax=Oleomonas cavernae TaxID=2320859 RepID=A0A418WDV8_9PROT|nr:hypothetical protein D3874_14860 [Oleomonas cavernae]
MLLLGACQSGRPFSPPSAGDLQLGRTTEAEVRQRFGEPTRIARQVTPKATETALPAGGTPFDPVMLEGSYALLTYALDNAPQVRMLGGDPKAKSLRLLFLDNVLIDYMFMSSFDADASDFDESRIPDIVKGQTIEAQVVSLLGPPAGKGIFPIVRDPGTHVLHYGFHRIDTGFFVWDTTVENKQADVLIDARGFVVDYRATGLAPVPAGPGQPPNPQPK